MRIRVINEDINTKRNIDKLFDIYCIDAKDNLDAEDYFIDVQREICNNYNSNLKYFKIRIFKKDTRYKLKVVPIEDAIMFDNYSYRVIDILNNNADDFDLDISTYENIKEDILKEINDINNIILPKIAKEYGFNKKPNIIKESMNKSRVYNDIKEGLHQAIRFTSKSKSMQRKNRK